MAEQQKIVVGLDGSAEAAEALVWARRFARPDDSLVAVHAWTAPFAGEPGYTFATDAFGIADFEHAAGAELDRLLDDAADERIVPALRHGRPGPSIVDEGSDADLIVVGHRGDRQISMMLGSTANYVLHHAERPVVVVRGDRTAPPRRVVVGVDDHDISEGVDNESVRALRWAYEIAGVEEVRVLHGWSVQPLAWDLMAAVPLYSADLDAAAAAVVGRVTERAGPPPEGVTVVERAVQNSGSRALIEASREADLVVVGSRGRGGFRGLLLGSTSATVAVHAHTPVAVVR